MYDFREWRHVFKLDPNKELSDERLEKICESGTDAIIVGGTDGITLRKCPRFNGKNSSLFGSMCP